MRKKIYEVEIKSKALINEGKKGLITYFSGGTHKQIVSNAQILYPQYTKQSDEPVFNITRISFKEYNNRLNDGIIRQKQQLVTTRGHILKAEDYENMGS